MLYNGSASLHNISCYPPILWNREAGIALPLLIVAAGMAVTLWGVQGGARCADRVRNRESPQ